MEMRTEKLVLLVSRVNLGMLIKGFEFWNMCGD